MNDLLKSLSRRDKIHIGLLGVLILFTVGMTLTFSAIMQVLMESPETDLDNLSSSFHQTSSIYREDGSLLEKIESQEFRTVVPLKRVPKDLKNAFIAIEDQRFYKHHGIDPQGILGSLLDNIRSGKLVRGGSTITQQLVKNVYLTNEKSLERKIREAYLSLRVEDHLSKDEILEAYLNRINLGQGAYGVQGAAQTYFSKNVEDLTVGECALLAGIVKSPTEYQPFLRIPTGSENLPNKEPLGTTEINGLDYNLYFNPKSLERQKVVLGKMYELGYINEEERKEGEEEDILANLKPLEKKHHDMSSYALDFIKAQATEDLAKYYGISLEEAEHKLFTGGYRITATIDESLQQELEALYLNFPDFIDSNTSSRGGAKMLNLTMDDSENIVDGQGDVLFFKRDNLVDDAFRFILPPSSYSFDEEGNLRILRKFFHENPEPLRLKDVYALDEKKNLCTFILGDMNMTSEDYVVFDREVVIKQKFLKENPDFYEITEGRLSINPEYYAFDANPVLQPQSSTVILDNETGHVKALVGGLDVKSKNAKIYNRATMSPRQPGTALMPFTVYGPALQKKMTMSTVFDDAMYKFEGQWWPENPSGSYYGKCTLGKAFLLTSYPVASQIVQKVGFDQILTTLSNLRLYDGKYPEKDRIITPEENPEKNDYTLDSLALGNLVTGVTNLELSAAYMTLEQDGMFKDPRIITEIKDSTGNPIISHEQEKPHRAFTRENAFLLENMLRRNVKEGSAQGVEHSRLPTCAEVGVNKFNSDLWVMGFTPKYTIGTWIGCDTPKISLNSGTDTPLLLWKNILEMAHRDVSEDLTFQVPQNLVTAKICMKSGKLATRACYRGRAAHEEYFLKGTEPTEYCSDHVTLKICAESGLLITKYCPDEDILERTYFRRDNPYPDGDYPPVWPKDYEQIPSKYCDVHTRDWYEEQQEKDDNEDDGDSHDKRPSKKEKKNDAKKKNKKD